MNIFILLSEVKSDSLQKGRMGTLKEKIIEKMGAKNLSISALEKKAGLTIHSLRNVLKGRIKKPRFEFVVAIAEALECSLLELMECSSTSKITETKNNLCNNYSIASR